MFSYLGCGTSEDPEDMEPTEPSEVMEPIEPPTVPDIIELSEDFVLQSMSADEVEAFEDKAKVYIVTVLEGSKRVAIEARFRGIRDFMYDFPVYECELMSDTVEELGGIASGMSGSPVGTQGKVMGALAYGDNFSVAPTRFWVTPIEAMEAARDHQTFADELAEHLAAAPGARINATYAPIKTPLVITGINPNKLRLLESYLQASELDYVELFADIGRTPAAPAVHRDIGAGDMIGVAIATGDVVNAIGYGTVTQVYDDRTFVAFGHPFSANGDGQTSLPVYRAVVNGLVPNLSSTYKSVSAYGDPIGTVTKDLIPGIVGELGEVPEMIPVNIKYQRNKKVINKSHEVAYGYEHYIPIVAAITQDAIRLETSPTTLEITIELSFKESKEKYTETFLNASDDTFFNTFESTGYIIDAFTDTFENRAEKATLTSVDITLTERPQIMTATIKEIVSPDKIGRGTTATFTVVLLPHWSAVQNGERRIEKQIRLDIPQDYPTGRAWINIFSKEPDDIFFGFDFGFDDDDDTDDMPETLDELIEKMESEQNDPPGQITVVLSDEIIFPDDLIFDDPTNDITLEDFIVTGRKSESVEITR